MRSLIRNKLYEIGDSLHKSKLIILPYNKGGKTIEEVLNDEFNLKPFLIIDDMESIEEGSILKDIPSDSIVLVASSFFNEIKDKISSFLDIPVWNVLEARFLNSDKDTVYKGVKVGRYTYGHQNFIGICNIEKIGRFCSINKTALAAGNHSMGNISTHPFLGRGAEGLNKIFDEYKGNLSKLKPKRKVVIGNDVLIGEKAIVLDGVYVGDGAIINPGSIVTKDVPDYAIVAGNPARILGYRYSDDIIEKMKKIQWWNWDIEKIRDNQELFYDVDAFVSKHY